MLEFKLNNEKDQIFIIHEDKQMIKLYQHGPQAFFSIHDLFHWLRNKVKYEEISSEQQEAYEETTAELSDIMRERGILETLW